MNEEKGPVQMASLFHFLNLAVRGKVKLKCENYFHSLDAKN